jgi:hypothetical protein
MSEQRPQTEVFLFFREGMFYPVEIPRDQVLANVGRARGRGHRRQHRLEAAVTERQRCPVCDWPMAETQAEGCVPGDCSYRPDDPTEQRRISERRKALSASATHRVELRE